MDYALGVPMYFIKRGDKYIDVRVNRPRFLRRQARRSARRAADHFRLANHLSTIFPEVRLKRYLEMRGSDGVPWRRLPSLTAFWVGLLYDDDALDACWDMVKGWSAEQRQKLRDDVPRLGFQAEIGGRNVLTLAQETLRFAARGLAQRRYLDRNVRDETRYLRPPEESIPRRLTPAEESLEKFRRPSQGPVEPSFEEYEY